MNALDNRCTFLLQRLIFGVSQTFFIGRLKSCQTGPLPLNNEISCRMLADQVLEAFLGRESQSRFDCIVFFIERFQIRPFTRVDLLEYSFSG